MSNFTDWRNKPESEKIYLAEVYIALHLQDFELTSGKTYTYELEVLPVPQVSYLPQFEEVLENGAELTERASINEVEANPGSWFYDQDAAKIYVHTTGSDDPDGTTGGIYDYTILAYFHLYFGSTLKIFNNNPYYPRISANGLSDLSVGSRTIYFGTQTTGNGTLRMQNEDKFFDALLKRYVWANKEIILKLGGDELIYSDYQVIFKGVMLDWTAGDREVTFSLKDYRTLLQRSLPPNVYEQETYPALSDGDVGSPIPIAYGYITSAPCTKIGTTYKGVYKIVNHPIHKILAVYNNGTAFNLSYLIIDLDNAEFTILNGYSGTPGTITVDVICKPTTANEEIYNDDFEDNDISEYDQEKSGGTASWTAAGGIVTGTITATENAFLVQPVIRFSSGEIEAKINSANSGGDYRIGIVWDYESYGTFKALVLVYGTPQRIRICTVSGGSWTTHTNDAVTVNPSTWYTLKLALTKNGVATPYLDGVPYTAYDFTTGISPKKVGLIIRNAMTGSFNDFTIDQDYICTGPQILKDLCINWLDIPSADIDTDSFETAIANAGQMCWAHIGSKEEASKIIERICHSNLCRFVIGEDGKVYYLWWDSGDSVADTIEAYNILGSYKAEEKEGEIFNTCLVKYYRNTGSAWKIATWTDDRVQYLYGRNEAKEFETYLVTQEDAEDQAFRLFKLLQAPVTRITFSTKIKCIDRKIGDVVNLKRNRGISISGNHDDDFRIVALRKNFSRMETTVEAVSNSAALGESVCENICQQPCETSCQETCELNCLEQCEITCEGNCQINCKTICQENCQSTCELGSSCETECQLGCEDECEISCQETCELACETPCELGCQQVCELYCRDFCLYPCQAGYLD